MRTEDNSSYLVGGENDVGSFQKTSAKHVSEGMVFLMESKDSGRGKA